MQVAGGAIDMVTARRFGARFHDLRERRTRIVEQVEMP